ncbi:MAG TPA: chloride channel protein [Polyangiaceae bacterium]|nr:chloride channel protein [Polyangiaceae bacterium]
MAREEKSRGWSRVARRLRVLLRLRKLYLLRAEIRFAPTEAQRLLALTVVIGISCGFAAVAFHLLIRLLEHRLIEPAMAAPGRAWMAWTVATPLAGSLACGALLQYVVPNARGSGIPQVKVAFARGGGRLRLRDSVGKFLVGALQIGSGSSLGREGPTVQICAGIASRLGRLTGVSQASLRRLLPVGAAAGIAAAFNAPIAAVTFTIEEVVGNLDQAVLSGVIVAAAFAAVIERSVLGEHPVFDIPQTYGLHHASSLLVYALIGVAAGLASIVFTDSLLGLRRHFRNASRIPEWARPGVGGFVTGALAAGTLEVLRVRGVTGGGYETLGEALTGQLAAHVMLALCVVKIAATVFSYASGGAGGIFAPALFIGGTLGGAVGTLDRTLLGHLNEPIGAFALVGMGAVFAGVIRAPMTSVLIIVEMTGGYSLILPLMIANMTAYGLARGWRPKPIYEALLEQDGVHLGEGVTSDTLDSIRLEPLIDRDGPFASLPPGAAGAQVARVSQGDSVRDVYPVVDEQGILVGVVMTDELRLLEANPELVLLTTASDLMRPPRSVHPGDDLRTALDAMVALGAREVPVTDEAGRFIGFVEEATIAQAYLRKQRRAASDRPPK